MLKNFNKEKIAQILNKAMQDKNMTFAELQRSAKVAQTQVQAVLRRGKHPQSYTIDTLLRIAEALDVEIFIEYLNNIEKSLNLRENFMPELIKHINYLNEKNAKISNMKFDYNWRKDENDRPIVDSFVMRIEGEL